MKERKLKWPLMLLMGLGLMMFGSSLLLSQDIPPINNLSATPGPYAGTVTLDWNTPLIDNSDPNEPLSESFSFAYEFREHYEYIDGNNWDVADPIIGDIPPIMYDGFVDVVLDLWVSDYSQGGTIYHDKAYLRAFLKYSYYVYCPVQGRFFEGGIPICNEPITFTVKDSGGIVVDGPVTVNTGSMGSTSAGMAEYITTDLTSHSCGETAWPVFTFEANWPGGPVALVGGESIGVGRRADTKNYPMCDGTDPVIYGHWNEAGGVFNYALEDVAFECTVPSGAVTGEVEVELHSANSVPGPNGMSYGVPGEMVAFELEIMDDPNLYKPIVISVNYPPEKLDQYGGLGESSLRAYLYDDANGQWQLLDEMPVTINREVHSIDFRTDRAGLFAIAAETDEDADGLGDYEELSHGTNPGLTDSDGDGVSDGDEIWFTGGDPHDARKVNGEDQYGLARGLVPGESYYIAARIVGVDGESEVSNCVYVQAGDCPFNPDLYCDGIVDFKDFAFLASWWLESYP